MPATHPGQARGRLGRCIVLDGGNRLPDSILTRARPLMLARLAGAALTFAVPLVLARVLVPASYGTFKQGWLLCQTLALMLPLGLTQSLYYFVPREPARRDRFIAQTIWVRCSRSALLAAGLLLASGPLVQAHFENAELTRNLPWVAAFTALTLAGAPLDVALNASGRIGAAALTRMATEGTRALGMVAGAQLTGSVEGVFAGITAATALRALVTLAVLVPRHGLRGDLAALRRQVAYALPFGLAFLLIVPQQQYHQYAVAAAVSAAAFAVYSVGTFQLPVVDVLYTPVSELLQIGLAEAEGAGRPARAGLSLFHEAVLQLSFAFVPLAGLLAVAAPDLIGLLFSERYVGAVPIFRLAVLSVALAALPLDGVMRARAQNRFMLGLSAGKLGATVALVGVGLSAVRTHRRAGRLDRRRRRSRGRPCWCGRPGSSRSRCGACSPSARSGGRRPPPRWRPRPPGSCSRCSTPRAWSASPRPGSPSARPTSASPSPAGGSRPAGRACSGGGAHAPRPRRRSRDAGRPRRRRGSGRRLRAGGLGPRPPRGRAPRRPRRRPARDHRGAAAGGLGERQRAEPRLGRLDDARRRPLPRHLLPAARGARPGLRRHPLLPARLRAPRGAAPAGRAAPRERVRALAGRRRAAARGRLPPPAPAGARCAAGRGLRGADAGGLRRAARARGDPRRPARGRAPGPRARGGGAGPRGRRRCPASPRAPPRRRRVHARLRDQADRAHRARRRGRVPGAARARPGGPRALPLHRRRRALRDARDRRDLRGPLPVGPGRLRRRRRGGGRPGPGAGSPRPRLPGGRPCRTPARRRRRRGGARGRAALARRLAGAGRGAASSSRGSGSAPPSAARCW